MTSKWVQLPKWSTRTERGEPFLIHASELDEVHKHFVSNGATVVNVTIAEAQTLAAIIGTLKHVLAFPEWCGSNWDSLDDAFAELRKAWPLPLVVVVDGLSRVLVEHPHLALNTVLGLSRLSEAFAVAGDQVVMLYVADRWGQ
ncbi:MAG: barstar family protein [Salinibacterium sp.]|nr:barstar family protein [Cryobacterium sp.]MCB1281223.1 barstar family protein [Salinibacterium sp.]